MVKKWSKYDKKWSKYGHKVVKKWPKYRQNMVKICKALYVTMILTRVNGQNMVIKRSKKGQKWSKSPRGL